MKYIVAVSGGVDSMALLDMMVKRGGHELIVAHFDHGIRADSVLDQALVAHAAMQYGLPYETKRETLGRGASEAVARERRYAFLRELAARHNAQIVTAHHLDDLVETVAINLQRGTGWRGLAALDSDVLRPLIEIEKSKLIEYAKRHDLAWREDSTNSSDVYLRNRVRSQAAGIPEDVKREIRALHAHQKALKRHIEKEVHTLVGEGPDYSRYQLTHMPAPAALECLRHLTDAQLTRPQLARALHAIKVAKPGAVYQAGNGVSLHFGTRHFSF